MIKQPHPTTAKKPTSTTRKQVASSHSPNIQLSSLPQAIQAGMTGQMKPQDLLRWQQTVGNRTVQRLLNNQPDKNPVTTEPVPEPGLPKEELKEEVELDLDEDGEVESHTLLVDPETGQLMLHSDPQTLEGFLKKYGPRLKSTGDTKLLTEIKQAAAIVHTGRYGTKYIKGGKSKTKAPTKSQRTKVKIALNFIAQKLQALSITKNRPPSHKVQYTEKTINSETFCEKIVMEPLSIMPRDDGIEGSTPHEETALWRSLTNFAGYKRGHMLNNHLHGPGTNDNLVPISTAFNAVMREGVEKVTKKAVNSQNHVVRFEAEARDWGQYPGAFGFPEEKQLPNKFYFKVTRMKKKRGAGGSQVNDWEDAGRRALFDQELPHDIPTDVIKGVVSPVTKTFAPGLYFYPFGSIQRAAPNYHLKGNFNVNNNLHISMDRIAGLGIDDPGTLKQEYINETVLTEYKLPTGYGIKNLPPTKIELLNFGKLIEYTTPSPAFIVYNIAKEARLKKEYQGKIDKFKEQQKLLAKQKLNKEQQEKLRQIRLENERKREEAEKQRQKEEEQQREQANKEYRGKLYTQIRNETKEHVDNEQFGEEFHNIRKKILYEAKKNWMTIPNLANQDMNTLLKPIRGQIEEAVKKLNLKEERLTDFLEWFRKALNVTYLLNLRSSEAKEEFREKAVAAFEEDEEKWAKVGIDYWATLNIERLTNPLQKNLQPIFKKAQEWDGESRVEKVINALKRKYKDSSSRYRAILKTRQGKEKFNNYANEAYQNYLPSWNKYASAKTTEYLWNPFEMELNKAFRATKRWENEKFNKGKHKENPPKGRKRRRSIEKKSGKTKETREARERKESKRRDTSQSKSFHYNENTGLS